MLFRVIRKYTLLTFLWKKFWVAFMLSREFYYERFKNEISTRPALKGIQGPSTPSGLSVRAWVFPTCPEPVGAVCFLFPVLSQSSSASPDCRGEKASQEGESPAAMESWQYDDPGGANGGISLLWGFQCQNWDSSGKTGTFGLPTPRIPQHPDRALWDNLLSVLNFTSSLYHFFPLVISLTLL